MAEYEPHKEDRFTFGLWTVGNVGRDPFGEPVRPRIEPARIVRRLAALGAYGVSLHDDDLVPPTADAAERRGIVAEFRRVVDGEGMRVPMTTVNLFSDPVFRDGALTSLDPGVRRRAIDKARAAIDLGVELGADIFVLWGGREGVETDAAKDAREALRLYREGINALTRYIRDRGYPTRIALEAKPNEPRGDIYLPTTGAMLAFIATLDDPDIVGVNPEVAHEKMAGLRAAHAIAQAQDAGKLFHVDLNDQHPGRYDQDLRFGSDDLKGAFFVVRALENGGYQGPRHFDAHAYRTEDEEGVWEFARGCMRTYLILREKVRRFEEDAEIQGLLQEARAGGKPRNERLDQLLVDLLLGVR
ncbi:MAG: xylose isomerase [Firmicutes bacterium]|nr:xylose isomerase [Bacillota bacterium]